MNEPMNLASALIVGIFLGALFFGGLWWTVHRGLASNRVALWFLCSMLLRTCIVLLGFYFVLGDDWKRLLAGLLGFIIARLIVTALIRGTEHTNQLAQKTDHAP